MDLSAALTAQIQSLSSTAMANDETASDAATGLVNDLRRAVPSFIGLQLALLDHYYPVTLTVFDPTVKPDQIATSLRLTLGVLGVSEADSKSTITFYAANLGAFVDLAADLTFALPAATPADADRPADRSAKQVSITVDDPLLPLAAESRLEGAAELSTINRAIGILIGHGCEPDDAHAELVRRAATADLTVLAFATRLVSRG